MLSHRNGSAHRCSSVVGLLGSVAAACFFSVDAARADGGTVKPLSIDDALSEKSIRSMAISPDGQWAAYSVCDHAEETRQLWTHDTGCSAWVQRRGGAQARRISDGMGIELSWSPDGRYLAYQAYEGEELKVWIWNREDDSKRKLTDLRVAWFSQIPQPVDWTPDGQKVLVKYALSGGKYLAESGSVDAQLPAWARQPTAAKATVRATAAMLPVSQEANASKTNFISQVGLALVDVAGGNHRVLLPAHDITGARLSPDGKKVAYTVRIGDIDARYGVSSWQLGVLDIASGRRQILAREFFQYHGMNFAWSPDSTRIAYLSGPSEPEFIEERGVPGARLSIVAADGKSARTFAGELKMRLSGYWAPYWSCDARSVLLTSIDGVWRAAMNDSALRRVAALDRYEPRDLIIGAGQGYRETQYPCDGSQDAGVVHVVARDLLGAQDVWIRIQRNGAIETTPLGQSLESWSFNLGLMTDQGQRLVAIAQAVDKPTEVTEFDAQGRATALTDFNRQLTSYTYGSLRMIEFEGPTGKLKAAVLLPPDFREGRRYPAVLEMYPGMRASFLKSRSFGMGGFPASNAQILATRGYITMVFDSDVHEGTLSRDIVAAVHAAADELVRRGWGDPDRMAMRGCSHAGYAVLATLMQTDRFKAGIAECGFGDLGNFWGYGWKHFIQYGIGKLMVPPWQDPARYVEHSPYYHADRINTPLLLVVGAEDTGFAQQSEQLHLALDEIGKEAVFISYQGEDHGLRQPVNVKDFWERMIAFLDTNLMRN